MSNADYATAKMAHIDSIAPRAAVVAPRIRPKPDYGNHSHVVHNNADAFGWIGGTIGNLREDIPQIIESFERAMANPHVAQPSKNIALALERITAARMAFIEAHQCLISAGYAGTWLDSEDDD